MISTPLTDIFIFEGVLFFVEIFYFLRTYYFVTHITYFNLTVCFCKEK